MEALQENSYQDVISFNQSLYKFIKDQDVLRELKDPLYMPIIKLLREGPKTIKEIEKSYNEMFDDDKKKKSDKSIYRYVKHLEKLGLVAVAGQRVMMGRNITETLYTRTAKVFYLDHDSMDAEKDEAMLQKSQIIGDLLSSVFDNKKANAKTLTKFYEEFERGKFKQIEKLLEMADEDVIERLSNKHWDGISYLVEVAALFSHLSNISSDFKNSLNEVFE